METYQDYPSHASFEPVASGAIAVLVILGLLWGLVELAQSQGARAREMAAAERACAYLQNPQDRKVCIKQVLHGERTTED